MRDAVGTNWLPFRREAPDAKVRLFCFTHAGGGAAFFRTWGAALAPDIDVCPVEYPGRMGLDGEAPHPQVASLVEAASQGLAPLLRGRFAFFGYSFGSWVAFELARLLRRSGAEGPERLYVAASAAPHVRRAPTPICDLPDAQFLDEMERRYGAIPPMVRNEPELLALLLPRLRADMSAFETYTYAPEPPLECALTAFGGSHDPMLSRQGLEAWGELTTAPFAAHFFDGGHFFIHGVVDDVLGVVRRDCV